MATERGEVRRYFEEVVLPYDGEDCLLWPFARCENGRARMKFDGRTRIVSRVVCRLTHGEPPTPEHQAAHSCGRGHLGCVAPGHLSWKTAAGNQQDSMAHGTSLAKLNEAAVREIRLLGNDRPSLKILGEKYGCTPTAIWFVLHGKNWRWLDADQNASGRGRAA